MIAKIGTNNIRKLLDMMGYKFPRTIGLPHQIPVWDYNTMFMNFIDGDGKYPLYISTNRYTNKMIAKGSKIIIRGLSYHDLFTDFDSKRKIENAQRDAIKLSEELDDLEVNHVPVFSAGKGFHIHVILDSVKFEYDQLKNNGVKEVSDLVYSIQNKWRQKLGLKTMDRKCMGTPTRICRMPYSDYVDSYGNTNGNKCCVLSREMLQWPIHDIIAFSKNPDFVLPEFPYEPINIFRLIDRVGYDERYNRCQTTAKIMKKDINLTPESKLGIEGFYDYLKKHKPCIFNDMLTKNPSHMTRIAFALLCKARGYDTEGANEIYEYLGNQIGYVDIHNNRYRRVQIRSIIENPNMNNPLKCETLKKHGLCIGVKKCVKLRSGILDPKDIWN